MRLGLRDVTVWVVVILSAAALVGCGGPSEPKIRAEDAWARPSMAMEVVHEGPDMDDKSGAMSGEMEEKTGEGLAQEIDTHPSTGATGAVFMKLVNEGKQADALVGAGADVATTVELHKTTVKDEVMKMEPVKSIEIPGNGEALLKPGDYHIMLLGLNRDLEVGNAFSVTLNFEKSESMELEVVVREP